MARQDFIDQLRGLGFQPEDLGDGRVAFAYTIELGRLAGQEIRLGFVVPPNFPLSPPTGPHVTPHLLPLNPRGGQHPKDGVHPPQGGFSPEWQYWSRPHNTWSTSDRTVKTYIAHIRRLMETL